MTGTGASTPTRSCLKRKLQALSGCGSTGSNSDGSTSSRNSLCKTVSFDGHDNIYFCDPDYDRHSVPVAPKLSYEDLLELKMLKVNMMCPQNKCASIVPVGIMPLLPTSDSPSPSPTSASASSREFSGVHFKARPVPSNYRQFGRNTFVSLIDDDQTSTVSSSSMTPPPSSPSDHSPNRAPLPMIATDEEGQLIFQFSAPDELDDAAHSAFESAPGLLHVNGTGRVLGQSTRRHGSSIGINSKRQDDRVMDENGVPSAHALKAKLATIAANSRTKETESDEDVKSPFPVPPSRPNLSNAAALTLTPSFFTLPSSSSSSSNTSSPANSKNEEEEKPTSLFPFAPPVPTTTGLTLVPPAMTMTLTNSIQSTEGDSDPSHANGKEHKTKVESKNSPVATTSPTTIVLNHNRSTSSSSSSISTMKQSSPDQVTPHASPVLHMRNSSGNSTTTTTISNQRQQPPVAGPLAALQFQHAHPRSPQLSGLPSPSLVPPSPLSLYPPSLDLNAAPVSTASGFFPANKKVGNVAVTGHVKRASGSALARPTSPVVKPLKS